jgi:hypothetical protein
MSETSLHELFNVNSDQQSQQQSGQSIKGQSLTPTTSHFTISNENKSPTVSGVSLNEKSSSTTFLTTQAQNTSSLHIEEKQQIVIDKRTIDLLETRMFKLVDEILENSMPSTYLHVIKKNIATLICHSMSIFFNGTFVKLMQNQTKPETTAQQIASTLAMGRESFWPNDVLAPASPVLEESKQKEIDEKLRNANITILNTLIPKLLQVHYFNTKKLTNYDINFHFIYV